MATVHRPFPVFPASGICRMLYMRVFPSAFVFLLIVAHSSASLAQQDSAMPEVACESAEACYRVALTTEGGSLSLQDRVRKKIERLRLVPLQELGSVWATRALLLIGVLSSEIDPAEAVRQLQIVQSDVPLLDDYVRLWRGEALLKLGEASQAAVLFESIVEDPDSLLLARASFRAGEAWYRAGQCGKAIDPLLRAMALAPQDPSAPTVQFMLADCQARENRIADSQAAFRHLWVRYPNSPEAREAPARLSLMTQNGPWRPTPDELYSRAAALLALALHADAAEELQKFLSLAPQHPKRDEAKFKLGTALVRLKRYDQARDLYRGIAAGQSAQAGEAAVWLARVYLRQDAGDRLLGLLSSVPPHLLLSGDQKATIHMLSGIWLDDQGQFDKATLKYRQAAQSAESNGQRLEALWRIGWAYYRTGQYQTAVDSLQKIVEGAEDPQWTPQALYWIGRTRERLGDARAMEAYAHLCRRYLFTYYCQLAQPKLNTPALPSIIADALPASPTMGFTTETINDLKKDRHYLKAIELKLLGLDLDAAKELASLSERYAKDRAVIMELCGLLSEVGEHHQALRLTRLYFREPIERGNGGGVSEKLWSVAYPTAYLPMIRTYAGSVDPFLAAAIIREESQYDIRALSRMGAVGLMQVMPATAQIMAKKNGNGTVGREELFDHETNIRFGVTYLGQLLETFSGNVTQVVASYNAGPQAVSAWMTKYAAKDPDEFVEMIPYLETRQYVKRVLRSYREYLRLAGASCEAHSLDKVC
jgi:soluble lytic murein transglycosylase